MAFNPASPVTGAAVTGLTSPTFTLTADVASSTLGKRYVVSALGGTQAGVIPHANSCPFDATLWRPQNIGVLQAVDPVSGVLRNVPMNKWALVVRKGLIPLAGQAYVIGTIRSEMIIPAGVDLADPTSLASFMSFANGLGFAAASGITDTLKTGTM